MYATILAWFAKSKLAQGVGKFLIAAVVIAAFIGMVMLAVNHYDDLVASQERLASELKTQTAITNGLIEDMDRVKKSADASERLLSALGTQLAALDKRFNQRAKALNDKVEAIKGDTTLTPDEKTQRISDERIRMLWDTYCADDAACAKR